MTNATDFDFLVIGGGSGGLAAAKRASAHGAKAAIIERDRLGGTCVNRGCVPKKVMFNAASIAEMLHDAHGYGFDVATRGFDWAQLKRARDAYVARLNDIYRRGLTTAGVTEITGEARFVDRHTVEVGTTAAREARSHRHWRLSQSAGHSRCRVGNHQRRLFRPRNPAAFGINHRRRLRRRRAGGGLS